MDKLIQLFDSHVDEFLGLLKRSHDAGNELPAYDALRFCSYTGTPVPRWVHDAVLTDHHKRLEGTKTYNKMGRHARVAQQQRQYFRDLLCYLLVNDLSPEFRFETERWGCTRYA